MRRSLVVLGVVLLLTIPLSMIANADLFKYPDTQIPDGAFFARAPTIFQDMDGRYWMGFIHFQNEGVNIGICWSDDLLSWSEPVIVDATVYIHGETIVFFQGQDGMYNLIYRECFITNPEAGVEHILRQSRDGINWSDEIHIAHFGYTISAIQLRDGLYCSASDFLNSLCFKWTDDLTCWCYLRYIKKYEKLHEGWVNNPYIFEDNDGRICITFTKGYTDGTPMQVYCTYSEDGGVTWIEPIRVSNAWGERHSSITQDKDGKYWIVWESSQGVRGGDHYQVLKYSTSWDLENWSSPKDLLDENIEENLFRPEIKQFDDGRLVVVADCGTIPVNDTDFHNTVFVKFLAGDFDNDGFEMSDDKFPKDPAASRDDDGDGYPDEWNEGKNETDSNSGLKLDRYPDDPDEWKDDDNDGYGDNKADKFPDDPGEWNDTDLDGHGDNSDVFPDDPGEWEDLDRDGFGDNNDDRFPNDPCEWKDTDGDRIGDNSDLFPFDPGEWKDSDLDGYGDNGDAFPFDPAASLDNDLDGHPDRWNRNMTEKDSITGLKLDHFPDDPDRWKEPNDVQTWLLIIILLVGVMIILMTTALLVVKTFPGHGK